MTKAIVIGGASTQYLIYGLIDPRDNQMRYVGATKNIYKRLSRHMAGNKSNVDRVSWLESLKSENLVPSVFDIDEVDEREWEEAERFWIEYYQHLGMPSSESSALSSVSNSIIDAWIYTAQPDEM